MDSTPPRVDEALREFQSALASVDELLAQDPDVAAYRGVQLAVLRRLGDTHHMEGRSDEALDCVRKTIALGEPLFESPTGPVIRGIVALARSRLALILAQQQRVEEAATEAEAAASELERPGIGGPILIAGGHALVAEAFATVAPLADTERRNMLEGAAQRHFEAAATLWREAPLAAPLEPARAAALARIAEKRTAK